MTVCTTSDEDEIWFEGIDFVDELLDPITKCIVTFTSTIEVYGEKGTAFSGDSEIIFTMPHSEYHKVYEKYAIDPNVPMDVAIEQISNSGRGAELAKDLSGDIARVDQFHWISFDD